MIEALGDRKDPNGKFFRKLAEPGAVSRGCRLLFSREGAKHRRVKRRGEAGRVTALNEDACRQFLQLARFAIVPPISVLTQKHSLSLSLSLSLFLSRSVSRPIPLPPRQQAHTVGYTRSGRVLEPNIITPDGELWLLASRRVAPRFPPCYRVRQLRENIAPRQKDSRTAERRDSFSSLLFPSVADDTTGKLSSRAQFAKQWRRTRSQPCVSRRS